MRRYLSALLLCAATLRAAIPNVPDLSGQNFSYDQNAQETVISGNAKLVDEDAVLTADEIHYNRGTQTATAIGHVMLTRGSQRLVADRLSYRLADGFFQVANVRLGEYPVYISADSLVGTKAKLTFKNAIVTLQEPNPYAPAFRARTLTYVPHHELIAEHATIGIGPVRPIYLPHFDQHFDEPIFSYFNTTLGYQSTLGPYGELGLHLPIFPNLKLGGDLGYYTYRGIMFGPSGSYAYTGGEQTLDGFFRSGFISDHGDKGTDVLGRNINSDRGYFEWQHQQSIGDHLTVQGEFDYWSDSEVLRDFRPREFNASQQPDNFLETTYAGQNYVISAFGRFHPNNFDLVQERLPEVRFDLLPTNIGEGFYERSSASVAVLREDALLAGPTLHSNRYDAFYELERPIMPANWFTLTPVAGGRVTYYTRTLSGPSTYTRTLGEVGLDAELHANGEWNYKNQLWHIDGLRHLFTPKLSYRYIPEATQGSSFIPPIDGDTFSPYLQPIELGDERNIDQLHRTNVLRFALDNTLQTRDPQYGSRDLLRFAVAEDFRFSRDPGDNAFSQIQAELSATPAPWMQFDVLEILAPQERQNREIDAGLTIHDGSQRSFTVFNDFLRSNVEDYGINYTERLTEAYEINGRLRYDARLRRFDEEV
ncbi:MAG: LPS-assembly protein LptD, partial [Verrucomicrobiota bacterium]|nr:LPS-assembly protein LptD [Verrucomicrobiota bacterium]